VEKRYEIIKLKLNSNEVVRGGEGMKHKPENRKENAARNIKTQTLRALNNIGDNYTNSSKHTF